VNEINDYKRQGLSITQISQLTGYSRPTIRKYLAQNKPPRYGPRQPRSTVLEPHLSFLEERLQAGVWNATVLWRLLQERGYTGGYTTVKDFVRPKRRQAHTVAVRRFETPPGHQAQVDWGDLGKITDPDGTAHKLNAFVMTLGSSRAMFCDIATDQKLPVFLRMHEAAFEALGGVPQEILYDNTKTVVLKTLTEGVDGRGEVRLNPTFADFARYWGFTPRLCRPYRPQTKGKVESGIGYLRKNFLCGRDATSVEDLRHQIRTWTATVANIRVHGTTHRVVAQAWDEEKPTLQPLHSRRAYPLVVECVRRVTRDAFVCWHSNRYSVPWQQAGQEVWVREIGAVVEILGNQTAVAVHPRCDGRHQTIVVAAHHAQIPTRASHRGKARLHLKGRAPEVEVRSLSVYEALVAPEEAA
jgi:transposase